MSFFNENPNSIFENIKELLSLGATNRNHSFHTPIFSNITQKNNVESRIVVLRKFENNKLIFNTDFRSPKTKGLMSNNNTYFLFYDPKLKIQLRIKTVSKINNQNEVTKISWGGTRLSSRKCYLAEKNPSSKTLIAEDSIPNHLEGKNPSISESEKGYKNFSVIENKIKVIDWLFLKSSGHRRLQIKFESSKPNFQWVIP